MATAPVLDMLTNPSGPSVSISLSTSLLNAVTWITKELFDLSNIIELYFLQTFLAFSLFFCDIVIFFYSGSNDDHGFGRVLHFLLNLEKRLRIL